jgi:hypothetical protein
MQIYQSAVLVQPVIDTHWRMKNLTDAGSSVDWNPDPWQALEQLDMIQKGCTELRSGARVVRADVVENDF